jgi:hypothetical protein
MKPRPYVVAENHPIVARGTLCSQCCELIEAEQELTQILMDLGSVVLPVHFTCLPEEPKP